MARGRAEQFTKLGLSPRCTPELRCGWQYRLRFNWIINCARPGALEPVGRPGRAQRATRRRRRHPHGEIDRADRPPSRAFGRSWRRGGASSGSRRAWKKLRSGAGGVPDERTSKTGRSEMHGVKSTSCAQVMNCCAYDPPPPSPTRTHPDPPLEGAASDCTVDCRALHTCMDAAHVTRAHNFRRMAPSVAV